MFVSGSLGRVVKGVTFYFSIFSCDSAPVGVYFYLIYINLNFTYIMYILIRVVSSWCLFGIN